MFVIVNFMMYSKISCVFNIGVHVHCAKNKAIEPLSYWAIEIQQTSEKNIHLLSMMFMFHS